MSLDVSLTIPRDHADYERLKHEFIERQQAELADYLNRIERVQCFEREITSNMRPMADAAGVGEHLWEPASLGITKAGQLIQPLEQGLAKLKADPAHYDAFAPTNQWGDYDDFVSFVAEYLHACKQHPDADIAATR